MDQKFRDFYLLLHRHPATALRPLGRMMTMRTLMGAVSVIVGVVIGVTGWLVLGPFVIRPFARPAIEVARPLSQPDVAVAPDSVAPVSAAPEPVASVPVTQQVAMIPPRAPPPPVKPTMPAWLRFAVAAPPKDGRPRIAIVIDDLGLDRRRTERAIALPGPLTLSFLAYASDLPRQAEAARRGGHELLVHVPMEPIGPMLDASSAQATATISREEVLRRLRWDLSRFDGYVGINNRMSGTATQDTSSLRPVMEELHARGLLFIDARASGSAAGIDLARQLGVPSAGRDVFLDDEVSAPAIAQQLAELERVAKRNGTAIAIGHPHEQTLEVLQKWLADAPSRGFVLVPVSAIVKDRGAAG